MVIRWHISPGVYSVDERQVVAIINGVGMLVQENILLSGFNNRGQLAKRVVRSGDFFGIPTITVHTTVHRHAPDPRKALPSNFRFASVGRALVDPQRLIVIPEEALGCHEMSDVGSVLWRFEPTLNPANLIATTSIGNKLVFVVVCIHEPGQLELFVVAHAFDPLCLGL